jgi:anti-sigma factor RsiW
VIDVRHLTEDEAQAFLDGLLDAPAAARAEAHLEGCEGCQALVASFDALSEALSALPVAEPPADFTAGVLARIDARERSLAADRRVAVGILGAVAALLVVALAAAGQSAWAPALSAVSATAVRTLQAFRVSSDVLSPVLSALRLPILLATAAMGIPLVLALARLSQPRSRQVA